MLNRGFIFASNRTDRLRFWRAYYQARQEEGSPLAPRDRAHFKELAYAVEGLPPDAPECRPIRAEAYWTVAGDFRRLNTRPTHLLPPRDVSAQKGVRTETGEFAALCGSRPLPSLACSCYVDS